MDQTSTESSMSAKLERAVQEMIEQQPLPNNRCRDPKCNGLVVKEIVAASSTVSLHNTPKCAKCGREYPFAPNAVPIDPNEEVAKFTENLRKPMTI